MWGAGPQGLRTQTDTLVLRGGWSRELERCTMALFLAESLKLKVEAERDIWEHSNTTWGGGSKHTHTHTHTHTHKHRDRDRTGGHRAKYEDMRGH